MPNSEKVSRPIGKNSTDNAQTTYEWKTLYRRDLAKAQFSEKINQFICKVENFVYFCIGKHTQIDFRYGNLFYSEDPFGCIGIGSVCLPKHKGASLSLCTYIN